MQFPLWIEIGSTAIHPHLLFEVFGYLVGISLTIWVSSTGRDSVSPGQRHPLIVAGLIGALIGAKILAWAQHPQTTLLAVTDEPVLLFGGKTIVGGLLGGMAGIELAKKALGIEKRTGDALVIPLAVDEPWQSGLLPIRSRRRDIRGCNLTTLGCGLRRRSFQAPNPTIRDHCNLGNRPWNQVSFGEGESSLGMVLQSIPDELPAVAFVSRLDQAHRLGVAVPFTHPDCVRARTCVVLDTRSNVRGRVGCAGGWLKRATNKG